MDNQIFQNLTDIELMALAIYGEARNQSDSGKAAIGHVIMNRVKSPKFGKNIKEVILRPLQFSCFNEGEINRIKLERLIKKSDKNEIYQKCEQIATSIINGIEKDFTNGSTHYFNPALANPYWADKLIKTITIEDHEFYLEK